ncbi:leishmanolysin-related zinc metalloendopeptidase [Candidatus Palauibacter sp.]|uniref:leishmanolysin-related zinc metalloendopeptidase n=1 Tax=Candidatus Palauibacter sp. TaxID=3101350 RepID=UPI003B5CC1DD
MRRLVLAASALVLAACGDDAPLLSTAPDPAPALSRAVAGPLDAKTGYDIKTWGYFPNDSSEFTDPQWREIFRAAERWEEVLAPSDPWALEAGTLYCPGVAGTTARVNAEIDDIIILFRVVRIDGEGGTLAQAAPCVVRTKGILAPFGPATLEFMPVYGIVQVDEADLPALTRDRTLGDVLTHEIGHALGFASQAWEILDLVRDARPAGSAMYYDTYYVGDRAMEAFDEIADGYDGNIVPVDNVGFSFTAHWRESVMGDEIMSPSIRGGTALSLVTANAFADLGYTINPRAVDRYKLPDQSAADVGADHGGHDHDDVLDVPVMMIARDGKIIPPR